MIAVSPPNGSDTRSSYADWLELQCIFSDSGRITMAELSNVLDITDDLTEAIDFDTHDELQDESIANTAREQLSEMVFGEIEYRVRALGRSYPFEIEIGRFRDPVLVQKATPKEWDGGALVYAFCLFASAIRDDKLQPRSELQLPERHIANNFQTCSCLAAAGYVGGGVASFGWPRANGLSFLPALADAYRRIELGSVRSAPKEGMPEDLKDGGIDIIAWRSHPDRMPGKIYLIGQCASGANWQEKSVVEYIDQLHGTWFLDQPQKHCLPAMFIPFTFHAEISESEQGNFLKKLHTAHWSMEQRFGLIFDRLRISHYAGSFLNSSSSNDDVDGPDQVDALRTWVDDILAATNSAPRPTRRRKGRASGKRGRSK